MPLVRLEVTVRGLEPVLAKLSRFDAIVWPPVDEALDRAGAMVEADAKARAPHDTGETIRSITHERALGAHEVKVGVNLDRAPFTHGYFDTAAGARAAAHWPPYGPGTPLADWAARHGLPPRAVAVAISRKGTPLIPYLKEAFEASKPAIEAEFQKAAAEIVARWGA